MRHPTDSRQNSTGMAFPYNQLTVEQTQTGQPGVVWAGLIYSSSGFGHEARAFISLLSQGGLQLRAISLGYNEQDLLPPHERTWLQVMEYMPVDLSGAVLIQHIPFDFYRKDLRGRINIVRTMFETTGIPARWVQPLRQMDEVWVPSSFNMDTFSACGIPRNKLRLVPSGVNCSLFHPAAPSLNLGPLNLEPAMGFTFLSNFVFGDRKGWDLLLTAYLTEFKPDEDVELLIKTYGIESTISERLGRFIQERFQAQPLPKCRVIVNRLHSSILPGLYTACDAFVLPSRGEAWGLPYIEAMACGLPTIGTRWGGNLEFMNDQNSYLIENEGLEDVPGDIDTELLVGYQWARPSIEHLRYLLRYVFEHREEAKTKGRQARADVCQNWTYEQAASIARAELSKYAGS